MAVVRELDKAKIKQAIEACADFCCSECPYQYLDNNKEYPLRCVHTLIAHIYKAMKENKNKDPS